MVCQQYAKAHAAGASEAELDEAEKEMRTVWAAWKLEPPEVQQALSDANGGGIRTLPKLGVTLIPPAPPRSWGGR